VEVFHGTTADVSGGLEPRARGAGQTPAISLATTSEQAKAFTRNELGIETKGSSVTKHRLDTTGFREIDWKEFSGSERWNPNDWQRLLKELQDSNTPGARVRGMTDAGGSAPQYVVLDRSRLNPKAKTVTFDPAEPFAIHENVEQHVMETLIKGG